MTSFYAYKKAMFGDKSTGKALDIKWQNALNRAHEIRKFEIELYWKRTLYFWGFEVAILVAIGALPNKNTDVLHNLIPVLALMGLFISVAWYFVTRGSKAWQENWEEHINLLQERYEGNLYRVVIGSKKEFYSVSRVNKSVVIAWILFWGAVFVYALYYLICPKFISCQNICNDIAIFLPLGLFIVALIAAFIFQISKSWRTDFKDAKEIGDDIRIIKKKYE